MTQRETVRSSIFRTSSKCCSPRHRCRPAATTPTTRPLVWMRRRMILLRRFLQQKQRQQCGGLSVRLPLLALALVADATRTAAAKRSKKTQQNQPPRASRGSMQTVASFSRTCAMCGSARHRHHRHRHPFLHPNQHQRRQQCHPPQASQPSQTLLRLSPHSRSRARGKAQ